MSRVYDCFTFSTELDLLEFRLGYLGDVVDHFVVVEAPRTFSGDAKDLLFAQNQDRFARWRDQIIHVVVDDLPAPEPDRWVPEHFQRQGITRGLTDAEADDVILVTDVDEIPDATVVGRLTDDLDGPTVLGMRTCYLRANWASDQFWPLCRATRFARLGDPDRLRSSQPLTQIAEAGTHFSYLMDIAEIDQKLAWTPHAELDEPRARNHDYLTAMQQAAVVSANGLPLTVLAPDALNPVQLALLAHYPQYFDFRPRPPLLQRAGRAWWRLRQSPRLGLSDRVVQTGDRALARVGATAVSAMGARQP